MPDDHYLQRVSQSNAQRNPLLKVNAATGQTEPFLDVEMMETALSAFPGVSAEDARELSRRTDHLMNPERTAVVFKLSNDLYPGFPIWL